MFGLDRSDIVDPWYGFRLAAAGTDAFARLLEQTDPIGVVARRAGCESAATLRAPFAARLDTSPRAYRAAFRSRRSAARQQ